MYSLRNAGFPRSHVVNGISHCGQLTDWLLMVKGILEWESADFYFLLEDDVIFCRGLREYMEGSMQPEVLVYSPFCPQFYSEQAAFHKQQGWVPQQHGKYLCCAQTWCIPAGKLAVIHEQLSGPYRVPGKNSDSQVGEYAKDHDETILYHVPSLAEHYGYDNSAYGFPAEGNVRCSRDFIGEDAVAPGISVGVA